MNTIKADVETPCNRICVLDPVSGLCVGCGRSVAEIAGWVGFDDRERAAIMMRLPIRLAAMTGANTNPTMA
ncbi:MAG TPA: DUF1289 domain-containing protein [Xanthobacteraceae bacterium]|nr:DUF1289 domain-containing protein [Xanthobacteraceae bacterium]